MPEIEKKMDINEVIKLIQEVIPMVELVSKTHGVIKERHAAIVNGVKGDFVWDYLIWNEITFDDENGNIFSYGLKWNDDETRKKWDVLIKKYGV